MRIIKKIQGVRIIENIQGVRIIMNIQGAGERKWRERKWKETKQSKAIKKCISIFTRPLLVEQSSIDLDKFVFRWLIESPLFAREKPPHRHHRYGLTTISLCASNRQLE